MFKRKSLFIVMIALIFVIAACSDKNNENEQTLEQSNNNEVIIDGLAYNPPSMEDLDPDDPMTPLIQYGEEIFNETNTVLPENVGNELSCMSCHADGGLSQSSSMVGVTTQFPQFNKRAGREFTIEDRVNGCMVRSMAGEMIEPESEEMSAMVSYLSYISEGIEDGEDIPWRMLNNMEEIPEPDVTRGEELYTKKNCMTCHADDGSGTGANTGPALWGDDSFNDGAGMARMSKMAGYIKNNMPIGQAGDLSDQEAADLAAYLLSHERQVFEGHDEDWPNGAPSDIMTQDRREQVREGTFDWTEIDNVIPSKD